MALSTFFWPARKRFIKFNLVSNFFWNNFQVHPYTQSSSNTCRYSSLCNNMGCQFEVNRVRLQNLLSQCQVNPISIFGMQICSKALAKDEPQCNKFEDNNVKYNPLANEVNAMCRLLSDYRSPYHDLEAALDGCSVKISPGLVEQVLKRCCNLWVPAYRLFVWAGRQRGYTHSTEACNIIMDILGKGRQFDTIWDLLTNQSLPITHKTFTIVIKRYTRAHLPQDAILAFRRMRDFGCEPGIEDFNSLLSNLRESKLVSHALEFYQEVGDMFSANMRTYNILIGSWDEIGDATQAQRILREMAERNCEPDIGVYNTLLSSLCKRGQLEKACEILDMLKVKGPVPSASTYDIFVHAYCEANQVDEALKVVGRMKRYGFMPDAATYNALILRLCEIDKVDYAYGLLDEMSYKGVRPNIQSYNIILGVNCKNRQVKRALSLLRQMDDDGCKPDVNTYNMLIKMLINVGCFDRALEVWNGMEERGFYPAVTTYAVLIHGFCKKQKYEEACKYFQEMIDEGIPPYPCTCELLKNCLLSRKQKITVQILTEKMLMSTSCSIQELAKTMDLVYLKKHRKTNKKLMGNQG